MSFEIKNSGGQTIFSQSDLAWRLVEAFVAAEGVSGAKTYTELPGNVELVAYAISSGSMGGGHITTVSGNSVTWTSFHGGSVWVNPLSSSLIHVYQR